MKQRELKFRALNTFGHMEYGVQSILAYTTHNLPVMQYIGLKDHNGKEIYEGDIIGFDEFDYDERKDYIDYYVVDFGRTHDGRYGFYLKKNSTQKIFFTEFSKGIVRGNIYENKELLGVSAVGCSPNEVQK